MQLAEEKQSGWLQVPRMGYFAFATTHVRGGVFQAEEYMENAIEAATKQWANGVAPHVEMISPIFEPLEGELRFNERGGVEGPARVTFPDGTIYEVNNKRGRKHGQGTAKWADGAVYVGQFENDKRHGRGTYTWPNGDVDVLIFEEGRPKGPGVRLEKGWLFGHSYWLLKDGEKVRKINRTEARSSFFGRFKLRFVLAPGQRGGEGARPAGAPFVTALHAISAPRPQISLVSHPNARSCAESLWAVRSSTFGRPCGERRGPRSLHPLGAAGRYRLKEDLHVARPAAC